MRSPPRRSKFVAIAMMACAIALGVLAGCGGGSNGGDPAPERDVRAQLDRALRQPVASADVTLDAELSFSGLKSVSAPVRVQASGVYVGGRGAMPAADLDIDVGTTATGPTIQTGILSTGRRTFVKFGGELYEQPQASVRRVTGDRGVSLRSLGLRPRSWISDARDRGDDEVAGVPTDHLSARIDVRRMLGDLNGFARRSSRQLGAAGAQAPSPLASDQLDQLASYAEDLSFDVYVGRRDGVIRRVSSTIEVKVPEAERGEVSGLEAATLQMTMELAGVGGDQTVQAPARSRPIADLTSQLGGLRALRMGFEGVLGGDADSSSPEDGTTTTPSPEDGTGASEDPDVLGRYSDCLDRAGPADTDALDRCGDLLR